MFIRVFRRTLRFEPPDMLATHKLASQVKSQVNDVQVKSRVISLNSKSSRKS